MTRRQACDRPRCISRSPYRHVPRSHIEGAGCIGFGVPDPEQRLLQNLFRRVAGGEAAADVAAFNRRRKSDEKLLGAVEESLQPIDLDKTLG